MMIMRNLYVNTDILKVDKLGYITVSGSGLTCGSGAGTNKAGGSNDGRGGNLNVEILYDNTMVFETNKNSRPVESPSSFY